MQTAYSTTGAGGANKQLGLQNLHLCRELNSPSMRSRYDTSGCEVPVVEFWGLRSSPSLPLQPGLLLPKAVVPSKVPSIGQIEWFNYLTVCKQIRVKQFYLTHRWDPSRYCVQTNNQYQIELLVLDSSIWKFLTVCKQMCSGSFSKIVTTNYSLKNHMYKQELALNNHRGLVCY